MDEHTKSSLAQEFIKDLQTSTDVQVRRSATESLGEHGDTSNLVMSALRTAEKFDPDQSVRAAATIALEKLGVEVNSQSVAEKSKPTAFNVAIIAILSIAGLIILWDSRSWSIGGMNGLISMLVCFLTICILAALFAGRVIVNWAMTRKADDNASSSHKEKSQIE